MDRRNFIRNSSLIAAGIGIGLSACKKAKKFVLTPIPKGEKLKIGIIGTGVRGSAIMETLTAVPEFDLTCCCDVLDFRIEKALQKTNARPTIYRDYRKMLEKEKLDAVVISTPLHLHHQMVIDALDADLHVLCEKALAYDYAQTMDIKRKGDASNKLVQVSYQYQLSPIFNSIKELIQKGHLGTITRIEGTWNRNNNWRRAIPSPEFERQINWRMYREYSGGLMAELGSHQLNMIDNIIGHHPLRVMGSGGIDFYKDGREVFDNVYTIFNYPNGITASFSSNLSNKHGGFQMKFYGNKATIVAENNMGQAYIYPENQVDKKWDDGIDGITGASIKLVDKETRRHITPLAKEELIFPFEMAYLNNTWLLYKNFAAAIKGEEKLQLGLNAGYESAIAVHMANQALRNSEIVDWKEAYSI